ncbi:siroheme decarboxylase subunit alpha [Desulfomonile tiedjei]|uniref:siroheme decarboxylase n=1 Tax=Desulfomonile tiedjei (strain ATCC 49306 / DSM 6799 / DCB-1) TaxID=706587 RepID=I4C9K8_DESTA|nr:Lrp/AsnC family transcriptional regulator [Desulfomonile tiedjei]AFM26249.1 transcriptional regulator [Desulfomonile tiedjei DSM 6799]
MDERDKELLNLIQAEFPVEPHPYRVLGEKLEMTEEEVLNRIASLRNEGIIRRMGASINSRRVGYVSTLLAAKVPQDKFDFFVQTVNACPGVTHNYERKHKYNVWFTLISPSLAEKERTIQELSDSTGVPILELPARRIFKIRVDFKF